MVSISQEDQRAIMRKLRDTLAALYPEVDQTRQLATDVGLPTSRIAFSSRAIDNWFNVLGEAEKQQKLAALLALVSEEYPGNQPLQEARQALFGESPVAPKPLRPAPQATAPAAQAPNVILLLAANPVGTAPLQLLQEVDAIKRYLKAGSYDDHFAVVQELTVDQSSFFSHLQRHKPQIVHFSGHGDNTGGIKLADERGMSRTVEADVLRDLFELLNTHVRCVVLNACFSAVQAEAIASVVDCVVGMAGQLEDEAAIRFAGGFYQALANGESVERAVKFAGLAVRTAKLAAAPQLRVKAGVDAATIKFVS